MLDLTHLTAKCLIFPQKCCSLYTGVKAKGPSPSDDRFKDTRFQKYASGVFLFVFLSNLPETTVHGEVQGIVSHVWMEKKTKCASQNWVFWYMLGLWVMEKPSYNLVRPKHVRFPHHVLNERLSSAVMDRHMPVTS